MGTLTIHPAEAYLRNEKNPTSLYPQIRNRPHKMTQRSKR